MLTSAALRRWINWVAPKATLVAVLLLLGCATTVTRAPTLSAQAVEAETFKQRQIALEALLEDYQRLYDVGFPLLFAAEPFCKENRSARVGWLISNRFDFPEDMRPAAAELWQLGNDYRVMHIVKDSPADLAGLQLGDVIVSWADRNMPSGQTSARDMHLLRKQLLAVPAEQNIGVIRAGQSLTLSMETRWACDSRLLPYSRDEVNAFADGQFVAVSRGMMRFAQNDQELAFVVAHEIAHNAMGHVKVKSKNSWWGALLDIFALFHGVHTGGGFSAASANIFSIEYEHEADYVGLYIAARAEQDLDKAAYFWRRMAAIHPGSIDHEPGSSHPSAPQRFLAIEQAVAEIKGKQQRGEMLVPELK